MIFLKRKEEEESRTLPQVWKGFESGPSPDDAVTLPRALLWLMSVCPPAARRLGVLRDLSMAKRSQVIKGWLSVYLFYRWEGKNENEVGRCKETGKVHVTVDLKYYRPTEVVRMPGRPACGHTWPAVWESAVTQCPKPTPTARHRAFCHLSEGTSQTRGQWVGFEMLFSAQKPLL